MERREKNIFKKIFNKETKIMRKKNNKEESKLDNNNKYLIKNNIYITYFIIKKIFY